jgi:hypothetical protein
MRMKTSTFNLESKKEIIKKETIKSTPRTRQEAIRRTTYLS